MAIHKISGVPAMVVGGAASIQKLTNTGIMLQKSQGRRRPQRVLVLSDKYPTSGSEIASQKREIPKIAPMTAGAMSSTSVENFMIYSETIQNI